MCLRGGVWGCEGVEVGSRGFEDGTDVVGKA